MARQKRGKMALYEVMSKARNKPGYGRTMDKIREQRGPQDEVDELVEEEETTEAAPPEVVETTEPVEQPLVEAPAREIVPEEDSENETSQKSVRWSRKPRIAQINAGRIEFSMPYQLAIALFLGLVLAVLSAFQLGQRYYMITSGTETGGQQSNIGEPEPQPPQVVGNQSENNVRAEYELNGSSGTPIESGNGQTDTNKTTSPPVSGGSNAIVLVQSQKRADLEPVVTHFSAAGISTEIVPRGSSYFLQTAERYDASSSRTQEALANIKKVGLEYEAPPGYPTFAPHRFQDAYLMKVE